MLYRCVLYMLNCCMLLGLDWVELMMLFMLHISCLCIFMHAYLHFFIFLYWFVWCFSASLFLPLFLALVCSMAPKRKSTPSQNPLRSGASSSSSPSDPIPSHIWFSDDKLVKTFWRTSHDEAFIQNAKSLYRIFSILTFPLSSIVGVKSHYVASYHLSFRDHTGVLLQYARIWLFCILFYHSHSRYAHRSHSGYCIRGATRS